MRKLIAKRMLFSLAGICASFLLMAAIASAQCVEDFSVSPADYLAAPAAAADNASAQASTSATLPQPGDVLIAGGIGKAGKAIATTQLYSNATGTLVNTPSMAGGARAAYQALMFPSANEVLMVGGFKGTAKSTSTSISLKITTLATGAVFLDNQGKVGKFKALKSRMQTEKADDDRSFFPAVVLQSGAGFMPSGLCNGNFRPTAFTFDSSTNLFTGTSGSLATPRAFHTATLLNDGTVLITGGLVDFSGDLTNTAEIFDPTGTFTATNGSMTTARAGQTATLLPDGTVLIAGGVTDNAGTWTALNTAEIYDPTSGTFAATNGPMTSARWEHTATLLTTGPNEGKVLLAGGFDGVASWTLGPRNKTAGDNGTWTPTSGAITATTEIYDPTTGLFTAGPSMAAGRFGHTASLLTAGPNAGDVLMVGGFGGANPGAPLNTTELYNGTAFTAGPALKAARAWHTATVIQ